MSASEVIGQSEHAATESAPPGKHIPGEAGIWVLLFGDMLVFTVLFVVYLHRRGANRELFAESQNALNRNFGAINTLVLLTSSVLVVFAVAALRSERLRPLAPRLTLAGFAVGCCFVIVKVFEYHEKISAGITPSTNEFFMYYFVLTGLHLAHVVIGLAVLLALSRLARNPAPSRTHVAFFEGGGCFWHMVDLLWIVIFPLLFLVR
ncbi:nitric oxide reductase NorE protein [Mycolicibacterium sp. BK556]|uniref:cytochrome c oxidase subunit 3 n=1 Tax=Mycobacteriaceae TaxID=1762 RepID=UPI00105BD6F8|nr:MULTISPECIES: cytochrome c oxidase subunit 3 [Mycobacteriaceae]MBB3600642.1 nitric oxide reductase NorE protein [Mycolicibacterium sp. BK556]MBB3630395.1 nitric oxide reductase NorE protein [Mycolicibacterium sp. BK607]MBB3748394.1 nitric oxide reductase NorE protein [Mycolicibacterium sp. BK634]TDO10182.1 nitric oxide reductase NorE protein [Mycobacterium sp. BK086]